MEEIAIKSIFTVLLCAALIVCMYCFSPYRENNQVLSVSAVLPENMTITDYVILRGTTAELSRVNLYSGGAAVVEDIYVHPGDSVSKGQPVLKLSPVRSAADSEGALYREIQQAVSNLDPSAISSGDELSGELAAIVSSAVQGLSTDSSGDIQQPYTLTSPIDGTVMTISCSEGQSVSGVLPCVSVSDLGTMQVKAQIAEDSVSKISEGMPCTVTVEALSGSETIDGTIESILPYGRQTGTFMQSGEIKTDVYVTLSNQDHALLPGYSAQVKVAVDKKNNALVVPYSCVAQDETQQEYVMVAQSGRAVKHYITTGYELDEGVEVLSGITADQLVLSHPEQIRHGQQIVASVEESEP